MKKQILLGLLAVGMLAACSNDDSLNENKGNQYGLIEGESAFLSLGIAMPSDPQTRANDDFNDGVAAEYEVKHGTLVLFKGTSESDAKLFKQYVIPTTTFTVDGTTTDQITSSSAKFVQEIDAPYLTSAEKLFAYVILNDENVTGISYTTGQTFETFSKQVLKAIGIANEANGYGTIGSKGLVMTSVPVSTTAGGSAASTGPVTTLTEIDATAVYDTKAKAEAATADVACIYVERAAVKVDVTFNSTVDDPTTDATGVYATLTGWALGNVNNGGTSGSGYYNTRQFDNSWLGLTNKVSGAAVSTTAYRFVCANQLTPTLPGTTGHKTGYRTYFGYDVNYNGNTGLIEGEIAAASHTLASGATVYTYENTFDENSQLFGNTTYVSFALKLNGGNTFYTLAGAENTAYTTSTLLETKLGENMMTQLSADMPTVLSKIDAAITADLALTAPTLGTGVTSVTYNIVPAITLGTKGTDAKLPYTAALDFANVKVDGSDATATQITALKALIYEGSTKISDKLAALAAGITKDVVTEYTGGVTYYATRIAHFGDNETKWSTGPESYNKYDEIYPTNGQSKNEATSKDYGVSRKAAWLGRWGIVRNNWYSLTVTNVVGIGDALPVDYSGTATGTPGGTPDDNPDPKYYVAAHIHILPWVKRAQDVILK